MIVVQPTDVCKSVDSVIHMEEQTSYRIVIQSYDFA